MRWWLSLLFGCVLGVTCLSSPLRAQYGVTGWYAFECPQRFEEDEYRWIRRCDAEFAPRAAAEQREAARRRVEFEKMKATLIKQPALPASRNRLIGRWQQAPRPRVPSDLISQITSVASDGCGLLFGGDGSVEFRPDRWVVTDAFGTDDLGPVAYREGQQNTVFVLPQVGVELLALQLETPDRFRVVNSPAPCVMLRSAANAAPAGGATPAAAGTGRAAQAPAGRPSQPPTSRAAGVPAPAPPARGAPPAVATGPLLTFNDNGMGYQCANGQKPIVVSCEDASATVPSLCKVLYAEKPLSRGGFQMTEIEPRSSLVGKVSGCKAQKVVADSMGNLVFAP